VNDSVITPLACTVRTCGLPLTRRERAYFCPSGHAFDIARSGYVNLLQPQDRRSSKPGDSKAAVEARAALERASVGSAVIAAVIEKVPAGLPAGAVVVDLGSGTGEMLGRLCADRQIAGVGLDLSVAAVDFAARRFPTQTWVVANADRRLPLQDACLDVVLSIHGRRNPPECARALKSDGLLVVALPASDDLMELRTFLQGRSVERDRVEAMLHEHNSDFELVERVSIRERLTLDRTAVHDLLRGTYRGARFKLADRVEAISEMDVTLSSELCVLKRKRSG